MPGAAADDLLLRIRSGELDACAVLMSPERAPGAEDLTVEAVLDSDPALRRNGRRGGAHLAAERHARLADLDADHRAWIADLISFWRSATRDVSKTTSPVDHMWVKSPDVYFEVGAASLRCVRLAMLEARKQKCARVLDFGCGYGRVTRYLRSAFPEAGLVVADIDPRAVEFCARTFAATPLRSHEDFSEVELPGTFDLIWVGSLFTHVSEERWPALLDLLAAALEDEGLLVFTVQGRHVRDELAAGGRPNFDDEARAEIVRGFDETGYGYVDWSERGGLRMSLNSPAWVTGQIQRRPGLRLVGYREVGWGRQDVVSCQARRG